MVRLWHLEQDFNYMLDLRDPQHMCDPKDKVRCVSFNPRKRLLSGGTQGGRVVMWKFNQSSLENVAGTPCAEDWDVIRVCFFSLHSLSSYLKYQIFSHCHQFKFQEKRVFLI